MMLSEMPSFGDTVNNMIRSYLTESTAQRDPEVVILKKIRFKGVMFTSSMYEDHTPRKIKRMCQDNMFWLEAPGFVCFGCFNLFLKVTTVDMKTTYLAIYQETVQVENSELRQLKHVQEFNGYSQHKLINLDIQDMKVRKALCMPYNKDGTSKLIAKLPNNKESS